MASFKIEKGFDIQVEGAPSTDCVDAPTSNTITVYPHEIKRIKARSSVQPGDRVQVGSPLFFDKTRPELQFCSPATGVISEVLLGERRSLHAIRIERDESDSFEDFGALSIADIQNSHPDDLIRRLTESGLIALIEERPFSKIPSPGVTPKAIFINTMSTAPFGPSAQVLMDGRQDDYLSACAILKKLTNGRVHVCSTPADAKLLPSVQGVESHQFTGPHPSGNASTHIYHLDAIAPGDTVWVLNLSHLLTLGSFLRTGHYPTGRIISVGGSGTAESERKHMHVRTGTPLKNILPESLREENPVRVLRGDLLSGTETTADASIGFFEQSINLLPHSDERLLLGWLLPGAERYTATPTFLSAWTGKSRKWKLNTLLNGSKRSLVLTGKYEEVVPMNIMVDFLIKAVLAHDTEEAVKLGLLETAPEDFALCSFICPSKLDICGIIQKGLDEVEAEGL